MVLELTLRTIQLVNILFEEDDREEVIELLEKECADNLPFHNKATPVNMERIRFAAIKVSSGQINKLYGAVDLAQKDWRDLLVYSGFANSDNDHEVWVSEILNM